MLTKEDVVKLVRPALTKIKAYKPVEPPDILSKRFSISRDRIMKLDANENPYGCSPKVKKTLTKFQYYNSYPDPEQRELRDALSKYTGINSKNLLAGSGSDELIELILRLFLEPGDCVINCPPTFGMYTFCTQICAAETISVPRKNDFNIDIEAIEKAVTKNTKVIFIASPNNPTGNIATRDDIVRLLNLNIIVVIDEAYSEFSNKSLIEMVTEYSNLFVLRTFSKWAGLAGLRVGYGIFPDYIVEQLMKIKQPYNVNSAAQVAATASLKDLTYLNRTVKNIIKERNRLYELLKSIPWLQPYESESNFILCLIKKGSSKDIHAELQKQGIILRYYDTPELTNYLRISVGTPADTNRLINELKKM
jgi:histidinol-phosphate aminotransferase